MYIHTRRIFLNPITLSLPSLKLYEVHICNIVQVHIKSQSPFYLCFYFTVAPPRILISDSYIIRHMVFSIPLKVYMTPLMHHAKMFSIDSRNKIEF